MITFQTFHPVWRFYISENGSIMTRRSKFVWQISSHLNYWTDKPLFSKLISCSNTSIHPPPLTPTDPIGLSLENEMRTNILVSRLSNKKLVSESETKYFKVFIILQEPEYWISLVSICSSFSSNGSQLSIGERGCLHPQKIACGWKFW